MNGRRLFQGLRFMGMIAFAVVVFGFVTMHLWNWLVPAVFGLRAITFVQALGLLVLCRILFGGFHGRGAGRRGWRRHMAERWAQMSPEERERLRAGLRGRWGCGSGSQHEATPVQRPTA